MESPKIKRVLISVTDKTGVVDFAKSLVQEFDIEIVSTGGSAKAISDAGINVIPIEDVTGFPEMMGGRVKTLHPLVHGALLAKRDDACHMTQAKEHRIAMIDMVVVNLYEFDKTVAGGADFETCIENIDIGGPSMLRSAAKNFASVTVVSDPSIYNEILQEMRQHDGTTTYETRRKLALRVFEITSKYDSAIALWLKESIRADVCENISTKTCDFPDSLQIVANKVQDLRYGENPHQAAAFYRFDNSLPQSLSNAKQLNGKPLSYNNYIDVDACWNIVCEFDDPAVVIVKHQNPCGSAIADNIVEAYDRAYACDPKSAYGGIVAVNRTVPVQLAQHILDNKQFVEVIIAPLFDKDALSLLSHKENLRILETGGINIAETIEYKSIDGGILVQQTDRVKETEADYTIPTKRKPTTAEMKDLSFAWKVCKGVKSNAILVAKDNAGIGLGPGQPNRVDSALLACIRAREACERMGIDATNLVAASDAFFPFRDNIDRLAKYGVCAVIQPGGSMRDDEVIAAADEHGIAMVFTGRRHFRH